MHLRVALVSVCAVVASIGAACGDDGRTLAPAPPPSTTTTVAPTIGTADVGPVGSGFALTSPAFVDGGILDPQFTCDGSDVAPPLAIATVPLATVELAIAVVDPDADDAVHWVVAGLPASTAAVDASTLGPEAVFARTDRGVDGWAGPCPPIDDDFHRYVFTAYALPEPIGLQPGIEGARAIELLEAAALDTARLTAFYQRGGLEG